jgi:2-keto-4-pentenoate hydratase
MNDSDFSTAVEALVQARREARPIGVFPAAWSPHDLAEAYRLQRAVAKSFGEVCGWKVAVLTSAQQQPLGLQAPVSAPLLSAWCAASPAHWRRDAFITPLLECEFAFELGRDLPPRPKAYSRAEVSEAVAALRIVMEVVDHRVPRGLPVLVELADGFNNGAFVIGPSITDWRQIDFASQGIVLRATGSGQRTEIALGSGHAILEGDLLGALVMMANSQPAMERGLKAGDIVTTGSCTGALPPLHGASYEADFGELGRVELHLD